MHQLALRPLRIHNKISPRHKPLKRAVRPCLWQSRQKINDACMALQEHFGHTCRAAEVAVDLEGGMCIPQIRQRAEAQ